MGNHIQKCCTQNRCCCWSTNGFPLEMSFHWGERSELKRSRRNLLDNLFANNVPELQLSKSRCEKHFSFLCLWICWFCFFPSVSVAIYVIVVRKLQRNYVIKKSSYCDEWCYQYHRRWDSLPLSSSWIIPWAVLMDQASVCGNASILWPPIKRVGK